MREGWGGEGKGRRGEKLTAMMTIQSKRELEALHYFAVL